MRRRAPRPRLKTGTAGDGPADTATVVIGLDDSSMSLAPFRWGCQEARRLDGRAVAVLITPAARSAMTALCAAAGFAAVGYLVADPAVDEQAEDLAAEILRQAVGLDLAFIRASGRPVAELLRIAGEVHADLIVVGGSAATRDCLVGCVGRRLAGRRREPVIVVIPPRFETRTTCLEK